MRRGRLLLPWGLLAGLLLWSAAIDGLSIKAPSLLKKSRNVTTNVSTTTTTPTPTDLDDDEEELAPDEGEDEPDAEGANANATKSHLTGDPQKDYRFDPNLPRELPPGYNLSAYPFFSRVPKDVTFECGDELLDGYYANVHYKCQVYHHCLSGLRYDFLCANYTAFDQKTFTCSFVSEVDCVNSAKFWNRNKGLYETPTTSTVRPLTTAPPPTPPPAPAPARRPAGGARRRRPYRRRRPQYDYYYDDEYDDDEYEDDVTAPGQGAARGGSGGSGRRQPSGAEPAADDKPFKADKSIYERPRQAPQIRRPVPRNERDKYEYQGGKDDKAPAQKQLRDGERKRAQAQESAEPSAGGRGRARPRPAEDDEYYDDEAATYDEAEADDYELPRAPARKQHQDFGAGPSAAERDFVRRPAKSGQGRPLRRNRPGARRKPMTDDDYYEDDRRSRPTAPDSEARRRPTQDEPARRRPEPESRRRPATVDDDAPRRRPSASDRRPADADDALDAPRKRRPSSVGEQDEEGGQRQRPLEEPRRAVGSAAPRRRAPPRAEEYEKEPSYERQASREGVRAANPRDVGEDRRTSGAKERTRTAPTPADEIPLSSYARDTTPYVRDTTPYVRDTTPYVRDTTPYVRETTPYVRETTPYARETTPRTRGGSGFEQTGFGDDRERLRASSGVGRTRGSAPLAADGFQDPIAAPKPAYISATGRGGTTFKATKPDREALRAQAPTGPARGASRGVAKTTSTTTHAPLADDEEYYDDDEVIEEEVPTGPEKTALVSQEAAKPSRSRPTGRDETFDADKKAVDIADKPLLTSLGRPADGSAPAQKLSASSTFRFNEDGVLLETLPARQGFRPKSATSPAPLAPPAAPATPPPAHRRKANQASNIESTQVAAPAPAHETAFGASQDVDLGPSSTPRLDVVATTDAPIRLETEGFDVARPSGPSGRGSLNFRKNTPRPLQDSEFPPRRPAVPQDSEFPPRRPAVPQDSEFPPRRPAVLPDIGDPEYDVTLNEAIHPTQAPFFKAKVPLYSFGSETDFASGGGRQAATLLSAASQTHEAKAPFPLHTKAALPDARDEGEGEEFEDEVEYEDDDPAIPTGRGAAEPQDTPIPTGRGAALRFEWTTQNPRDFRGSEASLPPNGATTPSAQAFYTNRQPAGQETTPTLKYPTNRQPSGQANAAPRGALRDFQQQQVYVPTRSANQQYYQAAAMLGADAFRAGQPLGFGASYDFDLPAKYRPRRKFLSRDAQDYFGKFY